jgi:hypothetical protein
MDSVSQINLLDIIQKINHFLDLLNLDGRKLLMLSVTCKYIREIFFTIKHFPFNDLKLFKYNCNNTLLNTITFDTYCKFFCKFFKRMKCLTTTDLSYVNHLFRYHDFSNLYSKQLAETVSSLTTLTQLNFSENNHFVNLDCFPLLTNLTELTITNISTKLNSILSLTRLRKLNISNNYNYMGKEFLGHLSQLVNLNELIMSCNRHDKSETVALEYSLSKMPEITSLNISYTNLPAINLLSMPKLQKLNVSHIENIQYSIFISLTQLTSLNLDGFNIMTIQNLPILSCMTNLISLSLCNNQITSNLPILSCMTNLISLSLCNNQITSNGLLQLLPMFYRMKDLTTLELAYNHLRPRKDRAILLQKIPWLRTITLYTYKPHKKE